MARKIEISRDLVMGAMRHPAVIEHLRKIAKRVESRAQAIAASENVEMDTEVIEFTRPGGRPVAQVVSHHDEQEFGTSRHGKYRILGRAAREAG